MAESGNALPREERLRKRREFLRVYERGAKVKTKLFFIYLLENGLPYSKLGITVSRKVGKTTVRNPPCDLVINTSSITARATLAELEEEFRRPFSESGEGKRP